MSNIHDPRNESAQSMTALMMFALKYDVPIPITYFSDVISRSEAFRARKAGKLILESVASQAAVKPSLLAAYLGKKCGRGIGVAHSEKEAA